MNKTSTTQNVYDKIKNFITENTNNLNYKSWYVGIASDPQERLFIEHNVNKDSGTWIYNKCHNNTSAREVEKALINNLGTKGGPSGGDESTIYVYAYIITPRTRE